MTDKKKNLLFWVYTALLTAALMIIQYNGVFSIGIGGANPMLMLCMCVSFSIFAGELDSVIFCTVAGFLTDAAASGTTAFFNTAVFMLTGLAVSLTVRYLFNNNFRSALVLGIICGVVYHVLRFAVCVPKNGLENSVVYLLSISLPSVIYTAAVTLILYFAQKRIFTYYKAR